LIDRDHGFAQVSSRPPLKATIMSLAFLDRLLRDDATTELLGTQATFDAMLRFELALARASARHGLMSDAALVAIEAAGAGFVPDLDQLAEATLKDGVVVPDFVRQLRRAVGGAHETSVHLGATSQDVIDTALALTLGDVLDLLQQRLMAVDTAIATLQQRFGPVALMGRTRMQAAIPITVGDRLAVWLRPVKRQLDSLETHRCAIRILSLAGAAGTAEKFGDQIHAVRDAMAADLGLTVPDYVPHADRARMADFAGWLSLTSGALAKIGQDVALMAQTGIDEIMLSGGGGSSAMPHKQNPVRAELLVTLGRFNATQLSGMHHALIHEQERSGAAWTLEWMILPGMIEATATALMHAQVMLASVERMGGRGKTG
jgi:3-carboxy-cis,cis-muconate cycloisomerase